MTNRWIPVSERVPAEPGMYYGILPSGQIVYVGWVSFCDAPDDCFWITPHTNDDNPTHWQPLPPHPTKEQTQ